MAEFSLGINAGFAINRYPEPEEWMRLVREEFQLDHVQFVADLLNPFLPDVVIDEQVDRLRQNARHYGINIDTTFTSAFTRVNHLLHPDEKQRRVWLNWFKHYYRLSERLGARGSGSHFGILSVRDSQDPERRKARLTEGVKAWRELSRYALDLDFEFLLFEPMSIPRELAWTIEETRELLDRVNQDNPGVPLRLCLDVGHAPHPDQRDPYLWCRELGSVSPIVHIQQTEEGHSRHWPFTELYNRRGIIEPDRVMAALEEGGADQVLFLLEISHRERYPDDLRIVDDLRESADYWRSFIR